MVRRAVLLRSVACLVALVVLTASESKGDVSTNARSCAQTFCKKGKMCVERKVAEVVTTECMCPVSCSSVHLPVCSVYHVEFPNICELHKFACANEIHIQVKHQGNCTEQETTSACPKSDIINFQDKYFQRNFIYYKADRVFSVIERLRLAKRNFDMFWDRDRNGLLTEAEILRILQEIMHINRACTTGLIRSCDNDGNPGINKQEWYTCMKTEGAQWHWSPWTDCTVSCGGGWQRRTGTCILPSTGQKLERGLCDGRHHQTRKCSNGECPVAQWSPWTDCTVSCGGGWQRRTSTCILPSTGQKLERGLCDRRHDQTRKCSNGECPVVRWSPWTDCTVSCGSGWQRRTSTCIFPSTGQKLERGLCDGRHDQTRKCSNGECPVAQWSPWTDCTVSCGGGWQRRTSTCILPSTGQKLERGLCDGKHDQTRKCSNGECPDWMVSTVTDGKWSRWSSWTDCSRSCAKGRQSRTRTCTNKATGKPLKNGWCAGKPLQEKTCADWKCPDLRKRKCPLNKEGPLKGRVLSTHDTPLAGANVSLAESPYKILSQSQENGFFVLDAFCFDKVKDILITKHGYVPQRVRITDSRSTLEIKMENAVHPTVTAHPEDRRRFVGQDVTFCCQVEGNPPPVIEWFRNENVLDKEEYYNNETLVLQRVGKNMAGNFRCRAVNEFGAEFSQSATLTVLDPVIDTCQSIPSDHFVTLPGGCLEDGTGKTEINIGKCNKHPCLRADTPLKQLCEEEEHCCQPDTVFKTTVRCGLGEFSVEKVMSCGCDVCGEESTIVKGVVLGGPDETPVEYCDILVNGTLVAFSEYDGTFELPVNKSTKRLVVTFRDYIEEFQESTVVLPFQKGTTTFHKIHLRPEVEPVEFDAQEEKAVPLGEDEAAEVVIPANSLIDKDGKPAKGKAKVKVQFDDPRNEQDILESPGDFTTVDEEGEEQLLRTYGLLRIKVQDENNNNLGLTKDLHLNINLEQLTGETFNESAAIPHMWWLDEKTGRWVDTGELKRNPELPERRKKRQLWYRAFSGVIGADRIRNAYNVDIRYDQCFAKVKAIGQGGAGIQGAKVTSIFVNPRGRAQQGYRHQLTDSNGYACISTQCNSNGYMEVEKDGSPLKPRQEEVSRLPPETGASIDTHKRRIKFNPGSRLDNGPVYQKSQESSCQSESAGQNFFSFHRENNGQVFNQDYKPVNSTGRRRRRGAATRCFIKVLTSGTYSTLVKAESFPQNREKEGEATKQTEPLNNNKNLYAVCLGYRCPRTNATIIHFTVLTGECQRSLVQEKLGVGQNNNGLPLNVARVMIPKGNRLSGSYFGLFQKKDECAKTEIDENAAGGFEGFAVKFNCARNSLLPG